MAISCDSFVLSQKCFMLNHTQGCLLHAALAISTIIDNLQSVGVYCFSQHLLPKTRTAVLVLSLWPSFPASSLWRKPHGVIQSIYGNIERWATYVQNAPFLEKIMNWGMGDPCTIFWPKFSLGTFLEPGSLTVELYSKICVNPYPKRNFKKSRVVNLSIASHIYTLTYNLYSFGKGSRPCDISHYMCAYT